MFFSGLFQRKSDAPVTTPAELAEAIGLSYDTYTGKQISSQRAMRLTAVFSCVRVLAESVGMLPCNLYHLNGSLKQRATGERLHKLISTHPNGYMTPQEFWELVVTCLCLRGNFYAYKVKAFGEVAELLPVDPGCVVVTVSREVITHLVMVRLRSGGEVVVLVLLMVLQPKHMVLAEVLLMTPLFQEC